MSLLSSIGLRNRSVRKSQLSRERAKLGLESLETRQLMAGDVWNITGGDAERQQFLAGAVLEDGSLITTVDYSGSVDVAPNETVDGDADLLVAPEGEKADAIVRYRSDGTFQWVKPVGVLEYETGQFIRGGIAVTAAEVQADGLYVVGRADGIVDLDPNNSESDSFIDATGLAYGKAFVARFDAATGDFEWVHEAVAKRGTDGASYPLDQQLTVDRAGNVFFSFGASPSRPSASTANLDHFLNGEALDTSPGFYQQTFIAAINATGDVQRVQHLGSYEAFEDLSLAIHDSPADPEEWRLIVTGSAAGKVYLGDADSLAGQTTVGQPNAILGELQGYYDADMMLASFTMGGDVDWAQTFEGSLRQWILSVEVDEAGTIYAEVHSYNLTGSTPQLEPIQFDANNPTTKFEGELDLVATFDISGDFIAADMMDLEILGFVGDEIFGEVSGRVPQAVGGFLMDDNANGDQYVIKVDKNLNVTPLFRHDAFIKGMAVEDQTITAWGGFSEGQIIPGGLRPEVGGSSDVFATRFEVAQPLNLPTVERAVAFEDSFENGTTSNDWNGNWSEDSQNDWFRSSQRAWAGGRSAEVDGRANDASLTSRAIDLSEYVTAELSFSWFIETGLDTGEYVAADIWNGESWNEIRRLKGNESTENAWADFIYQLDEEYLNEDFKVRFRGTASSSWEDANVDDVRIRGVIPSTQGNETPSAVDDDAFTYEDQALTVNVLANDSDPEGDNLSVTSVTPPSSGITEIVDGQIRYTPFADFNGSDWFTYTIADTAGNEDTATVSLTVAAVNDAPDAVDDSYSVDQDAVLTIDNPGMLFNDSDVDGDSLTTQIVSAPTEGALTMHPDGSFQYTPNSGFVGSDSFTYRAVDVAGAISNAATVTIQVDAVASGPKLSHGAVESVDGTWQTIALGESYDSAVIVATPRYNNGSGPGVVRISNVTADSFDVRVEGVGTSAFNGGIHFIAIEEGVYDVPGEYKLEAVKVDTSTTSSKSGGWRIGSQSYQQSYTNPVVVGQVMSSNDSDWSVFWSSSSSRTSPANSSSLNVGHHVGEDTDTTRVSETIGYFVIESTTSGNIEGLEFTAGVGSDTIRGIENGNYRYSSAAPSGAATAVLSIAGMDGGDGGWAALLGSNPLGSSGSIDLAVDEDQKRDSERKHTTEQVAFFVIGGPAGEGEANGQVVAGEITTHDPLDVNGDGYKSPIDALAVINSLNSKSPEEGDMALDTNGDGHLSAIDALLVVNYLNGSSGSADGESDATTESLFDGYFAEFEMDEKDISFGLGL